MQYLAQQLFRFITPARKVKRFGSQYKGGQKVPLFFQHGGSFLKAALTISGGSAAKNKQRFFISFLFAGNKKYSYEQKKSACNFYYFFHC
jgi:hypothetical protein